MGFNNGYDSGYSDALEDVRNGRVAGLGPAAEAPQEAASTTRSPKTFTITVAGDIAGSSAIRSLTVIEGFDELLETTGSIDAGTGSALISISEPRDGFVDGDILAFSCSLGPFSEDCHVMLDGSDIRSVIDIYGYNVLRYNGSSFVRTSVFESAYSY